MSNKSLAQPVAPVAEELSLKDLSANTAGFRRSHVTSEMPGPLAVRGGGDLIVRTEQFRQIALAKNSFTRAAVEERLAVAGGIAANN